MRILGIDPGYGLTGFGLIESDRGQNRLLRCGVITTPPGADFSARLEMIYEDIRQFAPIASFWCWTAGLRRTLPKTCPYCKKPLD